MRAFPGLLGFAWFYPETPSSFGNLPKLHPTRMIGAYPV
jgi:hypothetical protein